MIRKKYIFIRSCLAKLIATTWVVFRTLVNETISLRGKTRSKNSRCSLPTYLRTRKAVFFRIPSRK